MEILALHKRAVERYQSYIRSFIDIRDDDIRQEVTAQLDSGKLWPEPLIQFNPAYKSGKSIETLVKDGVLRPELAKVFAGYQLYDHQEQALRLGATKKSFVVTSGTGSGKSLIYLGTVFNRLFSTGYGKGVKALIVYPMNALINSQMEELKKYAETYEKSGGSPFPITFNAYTGQTANEVRQQIISSPPDILLTNATCGLTGNGRNHGGGREREQIRHDTLPVGTLAPANDQGPRSFSRISQGRGKSRTYPDRKRKEGSWINYRFFAAAIKTIFFSPVSQGRIFQ